MSLDIFLTNNLTNKKEKFIPKDKNNVRMYVCGPTVYDDPHIGNARPLVVFDILYKILKNKYGSRSVKYIRNITDIDDKIIKASNDQNISINDLTSKISKMTKFKGEIIWDNSKPDGTPRKLLNIEKIKEIGWEAKIGLDEGIMKTLISFQNEISCDHDAKKN